MELLEILFTASFWAAAVRIASPLIFATMGELICERAGVLNLGIEGIMVFGAFAGWIAVYLGMPLWWGVAVAFASGGLFGLVHATLTVPFGLSQHVVGLGITLLATASGLFRLPPRPAAGHEPAPDRAVPAVGDPAPVGHPPPRACALLPDAAHLRGLRHRGDHGLRPLPHAPRPRCPRGGENPAAVEAQGLSVTAIRMGAVMVGSGLMAVGGAFLTLSAFSSFFFEMVNGRGWICIALVVFGAWRPGKALLGALLFAAFDALQIRAQQTPLGGIVPYQVFLMVPFALSILALILMSRRAEVPAALMVPYNKGER
jgi:general nucleoside transport system permease protein